MVRLRLVSLVLAAIICAGIAYLAFTGKFHAVTDMFQDRASVKVEVEAKRPPPPPPPPPNRPPPPPPPEQRVPPPNLEAPPSPILSGVTWLSQPNGSDYERFFPPRALERGQSGSAVVDC